MNAIAYFIIWETLLEIIVDFLMKSTRSLSMPMLFQGWTTVLYVLFFCMACLTTLQWVQNHAARMIVRLGEDEHVTPVLHDLHWPPIKLRVHFRVLLYTYKGLNDHAPSYIWDVIEIYINQRNHWDPAANACLLFQKLEQRGMAVENFPMLQRHCGMICTVLIWKEWSSAFKSKHFQTFSNSTFTRSSFLFVLCVSYTVAHISIKSF